jgi:hypothetical protein
VLDNVLTKLQSADSELRKNAHFVAAASRRRAKEGGILKIESMAHFLAIAFEEWGKQAAGDVPPPE